MACLKYFVNILGRRLFTIIRITMPSSYKAPLQLIRFAIGRKYFIMYIANVHTRLPLPQRLFRRVRRL